MKTATFVILTLAVVFTLTYGDDSGSFGCVATSTLQIIRKLCFTGNNSKNQTLIDGFFGCYDQAPGKQHFVKCQTQRFGSALDNIQSVGVSCKLCNQPKFPLYAACLSREFKSDGLNMNSVVSTLNKCQAKVLGIPDSSIPLCH